MVESERLAREYAAAEAEWKAANLASPFNRDRAHKAADEVKMLRLAIVKEGNRLLALDARERSCERLVENSVDSLW